MKSRDSKCSRVSVEGEFSLRIYPRRPIDDRHKTDSSLSHRFWQLAVKTASAQSQKHFIDAFNEYAQGIVQRAADRSQSYIRTLDEYLAVRRYTIGSMPIFAILELDMTLPDDAIHHPVIEKLTALATDMMIIANVCYPSSALLENTNDPFQDIHSYNKEQSRGADRHNSVTILMNEHNMDLDGALSWIGSHHRTLVKQFMDNYEVLPAQWGGKVNSDLRVYVDGIANCVRAVDQWDFETERYFGSKGKEIQMTRRVQLLPRKARSEEVGPEGVDASLI